jgi:hypothetical protein
LEPVTPLFLCNLGPVGDGGGGGVWWCPSAVRGSRGGREELKHDSKMLTATLPPPYLVVFVETSFSVVSVSAGASWGASGVFSGLGMRRGILPSCCRLCR